LEQGDKRIGIQQQGVQLQAANLALKSILPAIEKFRQTNRMSRIMGQPIGNTDDFKAALMKAIKPMAGLMHKDFPLEGMVDLLSTSENSISQTLDLTGNDAIDRTRFAQFTLKPEKFNQVLPALIEERINEVKLDGISPETSNEVRSLFPGLPEKVLRDNAVFQKLGVESPDVEEATEKAISVAEAQLDVQKSPKAIELFKKKQTIIADLRAEREKGKGLTQKQLIDSRLAYNRLGRQIFLDNFRGIFGQLKLGDFTQADITVASNLIGRGLAEKDGSNIFSTTRPQVPEKLAPLIQQLDSLLQTVPAAEGAVQPSAAAQAKEESALFAKAKGLIQQQASVADLEETLKNVDKTPGLTPEEKDALKALIQTEISKRKK
jgi:hypothetical protein